MVYGDIKDSAHHGLEEIGFLGTQSSVSGGGGLILMCATEKRNFGPDDNEPSWRRLTDLCRAVFQESKAPVRGVVWPKKQAMPTTQREMWDAWTHAGQAKTATPPGPPGSQTPSAGTS
jgi:hypothetical protein